MFTPPEVATDWPAAWLPGQAKAAPRRKGKLLAPGGGKTSAECGMFPQLSTGVSHGSHLGISIVLLLTAFI